LGGGFRLFPLFLAGGFDALQLLVGLEEGSLQTAFDRCQAVDEGGLVDQVLPGRVFLVEVGPLPAGSTTVRARRPWCAHSWKFWPCPGLFLDP